MIYECVDPYPPRPVRFDIEAEDDQESYFKARASAPIVVSLEDDEADIEYDSDGYPIVPEVSKVIDPLPPLDHSSVSFLFWPCLRGCGQ